MKINEVEIKSGMIIAVDFGDYKPIPFVVHSLIDGTLMVFQYGNFQKRPYPSYIEPLKSFYELHKDKIVEIYELELSDNGQLLHEKTLWLKDKYYVVITLKEIAAKFGVSCGRIRIDKSCK